MPAGGRAAIRRHHRQGRARGLRDIARLALVLRQAWLRAPGRAAAAFCAAGRLAWLFCCRPTHRLDIALHEAIQAHAAHYSNGKLDLEKILSALGEIASSYLAEIPDRADRQRLFNAYCIGIAKAANSKTRGRGVAVALMS